MHTKIMKLNKFYSRNQNWQTSLINLFLINCPIFYPKTFHCFTKQSFLIDCTNTQRTNFDKVISCSIIGLKEKIASFYKLVNVRQIFQLSRVGTTILFRISQLEVMKHYRNKNEKS